MNKKLLIISIIITLIYSIITLNTVLHHEVWADEAQVWQICTHLSIKDLLIHLKNEGHPALFYLMIMPFAKLFSDIIYMKLLCWLFMCFSVFLLLYYSPFKLYTKIAIILSAGFLYFFPVLARNYSIIPFLVFLAAILYKKSKQYPILYAIILALIANTHIIMFMFTICLGIIFYYENIILEIRKGFSNKLIKNFIAILIIIIGLLFIFFELSNTPNSNVFLEINIYNNLLVTLRIFLLFFINSYNYDIGLNTALNNPILDLLSILFLIILYILLFINLLINNKKLFAVALLSIGFQLGIYIFAYNSFVYVNRIFCAHIILIFCFWVLLQNNNFKPKYKIFGKKSINILLTLFFMLTIYNGINYTKLDLSLNYSGAKETADYIRANINPNNSVIIIDNEPYMISLVYYLRDTHRIYSAFRKKYLDYVRWDNITVSNYADLGWSKYIEYLKETDKRDYYVINVSSDKRHLLEKTQKDYFKLIFKSKKAVEPFEGYRIFKFIGHQNN